MKNTYKWSLLALAFAIAALSYLVIGASTTAQVGGSNNNRSTTVPAPTATQKKVVLKNLGMV